MSNIIVIAFDNPDTATQVAAEFKRLESQEAFQLKDARVVVKDANGKILVKDEAGHPMAWGAVVGGVLGALIFLMVPVLGAVVGALAGSAIVKTIDPDMVDKKFVADVAAALKPNTSAVFLEVDDQHKIVVVHALEPYHGTLIQTTLAPELEEALKHQLQA